MENKNRVKTVAVVCTYAPGGMRAVAEQLITSGVYSPHKVRYLSSHTSEGTAAKLFLFVRAWMTLATMLICGRCALVHIHVSMRGSFWRKASFVLLARLFSCPVVLHLHGSMFKVFFSEQPAMLKSLIVRIFNLCDKTLVLSPSWQRYVEGIGVRNAHVLPNFVSDPGDVDATSRDPGEILFLGEVGTRKGVFDLIEAFAKLCQDGDLPYPISLVCCGNGKIEAAKALADKLGIAERVRFSGWIGPDEKYKRLRNCAIFVLPSHNEGLPMSILEAMAFAVPCISTTVGGIPEMIENEITGLLIEPGHIGELHFHLRRLLLNPQMRLELGENAKQRYRSTYSPQAVLPLARSLTMNHAENR